ncbi:hypothetical protein [Blastococcus brunescens]|uniref:Uncharacterized protein n=1 Tax=Blastococcus brunescens TaxID=1564165 RepID=A0ABZ1B120_9ACTN|nr:hypothetical protein [Blastococcus sp. BMG 8361]WRL63876.1 hypothetical protein U6N30_30385 [Blastococcus sp. BMG 8361]
MSHPLSEPAESAPAGGSGDRPPPAAAPAGFQPGTAATGHPDRGRRPGFLRASAWLWVGSSAAGALGLAAAFVNYDAVRGRVTDAALAADPALDAGVLDTGVTATLSAILGGTGVLIVVAVLSLVLVLRRTPACAGFSRSRAC